MKLKRLLSIALPILGIATATAVAAPLVVSCSSSSPEQKPSTPDNGGNGSGGSNNGGGSITTPETKPEVNEKFFTYTQDEFDTRITGLTAEGLKQTKITIPATINDVKVTWIDFSRAITIHSAKEVFFEAPENITSINFKWLELSNVNFLSELINLLTIDDYCFGGKNIFPSTLDLRHTKITSIREAAFKNTNIQTILWPQTLHGIGNEAFSQTQINDKSVNALNTDYIPRLSSIGNQAFANCPNLTNVDWSAITGKYIGRGVFDNCKGIEVIKYNKENWRLGTQIGEKITETNFFSSGIEFSDYYSTTDGNYVTIAKKPQTL